MGSLLDVLLHVPTNDVKSKSFVIPQNLVLKALPSPLTLMEMFSSHYKTVPLSLEP